MTWYANKNEIWLLISFFLYLPFFFIVEPHMTVLAIWLVAFNDGCCFMVQYFTTTDTRFSYSIIKCGLSYWYSFRCWTLVQYLFSQQYCIFISIIFLQWIQTSKLFVCTYCDCHLSIMDTLLSEIILLIVDSTDLPPQRLHFPRDISPQ